MSNVTSVATSLTCVGTWKRKSEKKKSSQDKKSAKEERGRKASVTFEKEEPLRRNASFETRDGMLVVPGQLELLCLTRTPSFAGSRSPRRRWFRRAGSEKDSHTPLLPTTSSVVSSLSFGSISDLVEDRGRPASTVNYIGKIPNRKSWTSTSLKEIKPACDKTRPISARIIGAETRRLQDKSKNREIL